MTVPESVKYSSYSTMELMVIFNKLRSKWYLKISLITLIGYLLILLKKLRVRLVINSVAGIFTLI